MMKKYIFCLLTIMTVTIVAVSSVHGGSGNKTKNTPDDQAMAAPRVGGYKTAQELEAVDFYVVAPEAEPIPYAEPIPEVEPLPEAEVDSIPEPDPIPEAEPIEIPEPAEMIDEEG